MSNNPFQDNLLDEYFAPPPEVPTAIGSYSRKEPPPVPNIHPRGVSGSVRSSAGVSSRSAGNPRFVVAIDYGTTYTGIVTDPSVDRRKLIEL